MGLFASNPLGFDWHKGGTPCPASLGGTAKENQGKARTACLSWRRKFPFGVPPGWGIPGLVERRCCLLAKSLVLAENLPGKVPNSCPGEIRAISQSYFTSGFSGSSGSGVGTSSPGIRYFSPSHRARSISRHLSLQKGRARLSAGSNHLSQMGHRHLVLVICRRDFREWIISSPGPS